jgi:DNA-binding NarL/FixJ family response regulator
MNTVRPAAPSRRPILLIGELGDSAPELRQTLCEMGLDQRAIRSVAGSETLSGLKDVTARRPGVILLTLGEPGSGADLSILREIKADEQLRSLPVVVIGPSGDGGLVDESFALGAAGYMTTSSDPGELAAVIRTVSQYWGLSQLPS